MKLLLVHTLPLDGRRSSKVYIDALAGALGRLRADDLTISHRHGRSGIRRVLVRGHRADRAAAIVDRYVVYQADLARSRRYDVCHIADHGYGHLAFSLGLHRTVISFHDATLLRLRAGVLPGIDEYSRVTFFGHRLSLAAIRRTARVVASSHSARADLLRWVDCDPERVTVVHLGVDPRFERGDEVSAGPGEPREQVRRLLHVGGCGLTKNIETVLSVLARVSRVLDTPVRLTKVGARLTDEQWRLATRLGVDQMIDEHGAVSGHDLARVYRRSDVLLSPSRHEGFGLPVLEAMASGLPVVASTAGALPEVTGGAALLADPCDLDAFVAGTIRVLTDGACAASLRERGRARSRDFSWDRTARETMAVYEEVDAGAC